jgi:hypothetical protein
LGRDSNGLGVSNTLGVSLHPWREQEGRERAVSRAALVAGSLVYLLEIWFCYRLIGEPDSIDRLAALGGLMLGLYGIGLARAWELLDAQDQDFLHVLFSSRREQDPRIPRYPRGRFSPAAGGRGRRSKRRQMMVKR